MMRPRRRRALVASIAISTTAALLGLATAADPPADLVLTGGRIWTADAAKPWAEAVAIRDGRIAFVGDAAGAMALKGPGTRAAALGGRLVLPGFNDAHVHLVSGALSLERVDLIEDGSVDAVQRRIRAFAAANPKAPWVLGRGWLYGSFPGGLPTKEQLDAAVPDRPAYMDCYDGHSGWANSKALALAGITRDTPDPLNGAIVRDAAGEPTGALKESATALVESKVPQPDDERRYALLLQALRLLNSQGITSIQDAGYPPSDLKATVALLERAKREGKLSVRITASVQMGQDNFALAVAEAQRLAAVHHDALLRFGPVKGYVDGVIEAHTAAMLEPWSDDPSLGQGKPNWDAAALNAAVAAAGKAGLQVYLHAIGDRGVRMALDAHEFARKADGRTDARGRIEHIETISPADYPRFRALGVIASMQPLHANPDQNNAMVWAKNAGPDRASRGFGWGNVERAGGRLVFGSDWPVVTSDVRRGLYCAVARKTRDGLPKGGWLPEQAVSLENALRHYTADAAYASFEEADKGSIAVGKRADLVVVGTDWFKSAPEAILGTPILLTLLDGRVVHRDPSFATGLEGGAPAAR
jgi:predicted amidohydrolase YtcJ